MPHDSHLCIKEQQLPFNKVKSVLSFPLFDIRRKTHQTLTNLYTKETLLLLFTTA
jgi:hypothetical protein